MSEWCTLTPRPCSAALLILSFLVPAPALLLSSHAAVPSLRASVSRHAAVPVLRARVLLSAPSGDAEGNDDELSDAPMMEELRCRMREVQANDALLSRLGSIPHAFVLVFDPDTEDEAVYSIELPPDEAEAEASRKPVHSVVAFEDEEEAKAYAASVIHELEEGEPSIQALDLEALVVSSREAHFRVALVLRGDLLPAGSDATASAGELPSPYISMGVPPPPPPLAVSFTMVPDELYADRRAEDYPDPLEDFVWVLTYDAHTSDAFFFSLSLNGTRSVVCFREEAAALRCRATLAQRGGAAPEPRQLLLEEVLDYIDPDPLGGDGDGDGDGLTPLDVCLVDDVVEVCDGDYDGEASLEAPMEPDSQGRGMPTLAPSSLGLSCSGGGSGSAAASPGAASPPAGPASSDAVVPEGGASGGASGGGADGGGGAGGTSQRGASFGSQQPGLGPGANDARAMLESLYEADSAAPGPELVDGTAPATEGGEDEGPAER